ncbi:MAG: rod-binding protein [Desulfovibrio sp.]|nr:rod-binding protein [Desulfovibrio sp.]
MTAQLNALSSAQATSAAPGENARRELQARLTGLGDLNGRKLTPEAKAQKLREACEGFESVFIQKMWQEMRNTLPKNGLLQSRDERYWQDMYDQELAKSMTSAGGIGLADMMYAQLSQSLLSSSRTAAAQSGIRAFTPAAAPLLPTAPTDTVPAGPQSTPTAAGKTTDKPAPAALAGVYESPALPGGITPADRQTTQKTQPPAVTPQNSQTKGETVLTNPEIERALSALRSQQAMARSNAEAAQHTGREEKRQRPRRQGPSGLELARRAQRDAGDKLGPHSVRPPLQRPSQPARSDMAAQAAEAGFTQEGRTERYTTNMPEMASDKKRGLELARNMNVDAVGPNSRAGAGLAAYHAAQATQNGQQGHQAGNGQNMQAPVPPLSPAAPAAAARTEQKDAPAGAFSIPPLTADTLKS